MHSQREIYIYVYIYMYVYAYTRGLPMFTCIILYIAVMLGSILSTEAARSSSPPVPPRLAISHSPSGRSGPNWAKWQDTAEWWFHWFLVVETF